MAEETRTTIILTRESATDAPDSAPALLRARVPSKDRQTLTEDVIELGRDWKVYPTLPSEDVIRLRGGWVLYKIPGLVVEVESALRGATSPEGMAGVAALEPNRRIVRVPPLLNEPSAMELAPQITWNLKAIGITGSSKQPTGKGAIVAVLDSGIDLRHPDFPHLARPETVVLGDENVQDDNGHGTHAAGIIGATPSNGTRYSIAKDAQLRIINVHDGGDLRYWTLLQGMAVAAEEGAHIISMSLGNVSNEDCPAHSRIFELVARILLDEYKTIIVAAAGNESARPENYIGPIVQPADCPSFIAVAAVNEELQPTLSSSGGVCTQREPSIAAPGLGILSSFPLGSAGTAGPYVEMSGTSAAAPHVAGVAAMWVEKGLTGRNLISRLLTTVKPLNAPNGKRDVGAGLVQAPAR